MDLCTYIVTTVMNLHSVPVCCYYMDILLLQNGYTAVHLACMFGHTKVVKHLINNQADISATNNVSNYH